MSSRIAGTATDINLTCRCKWLLASAARPEHPPSGGRATPSPSLLMLYGCMKKAHLFAAARDKHILVGRTCENSITPNMVAEVTLSVIRRYAPCSHMKT